MLSPEGRERQGAEDRSYLLYVFNMYVVLKKILASALSFLLLFYLASLIFSVNSSSYWKGQFQGPNCVNRQGAVFSSLQQLHTKLVLLTGTAAKSEKDWPMNRAVT